MIKFFERLLVTETLEALKKGGPIVRNQIFDYQQAIKNPRFSVDIINGIGDQDYQYYFIGFNGNFQIGKRIVSGLRRKIRVPKGQVPDTFTFAEDDVTIAQNELQRLYEIRDAIEAYNDEVIKGATKIAKAVEATMTARRFMFLCEMLNVKKECLSKNDYKDFRFIVYGNFYTDLAEAGIIPVTCRNLEDVINALHAWINIKAA